MKEEQDDLTLVYMFGYKNGKDSMKAEIERLLLIEQGAAEPCDTCGWRMKFPNAECRNCENAKLRDEIERLRAALREAREDILLRHNARGSEYYGTDEEAVSFIDAALAVEKADD